MKFGASNKAYQMWEILHEFINFFKEHEGLYEMFSKSCFGHFLEFHHTGGYFTSQLIYQLLAREIFPFGATETSNSKIWFGLGQHACRFGHCKFCLITDLRFTGGKGIDLDTLQHVPGGIGDRYFAGKAVTGNQLAKRFKNGGINSVEDAYKVALVTFGKCIVLGLNPRGRVDSWLFDLVEDVTCFNDFPWGRYCFEMTRHYIWQGPRPSSTRNDLARYHLYGFIWAFQIWTLEAIPAIATLYQGSRLRTTSRPRYGHWTFRG